MNDIKLTGRIATEPEMRKTQSGIDVLNFALAVDRPGTRKENKLTDFFRCTVWGGKEGPGRAGVIAKYFHKGDGILIHGMMISHDYTDKEGKTTKSWEVNVTDFEFPMARKGDGQPGQAAPAAQASAPVAVDESEPLPF